MKIDTQVLHEDGFLKVEQVFSDEEVGSFRRTLEAYAASAANDNGIAFEEVRGVQKVFAIDQLFNRGDNEFLPLLTHPVIAALIEQAVGQDYFVSQEFAVIKNQGGVNSVGWHQDIVTESAFRGYMIGIYLDDADENEGCLRIIPQSHVSGEHICELQKKEFVNVPMRAGDVLMHELKLAHSSGTLNQNPIRRVVYIEVLPREMVTSLNLYNPAFIAARSHLVTLSEQRKDRSVKAEIAAMYGVTARMKPSNYCFQ